MSDNKLDRAKAAANLSSLGIPIEGIKAIVDDWSERRISQSLDWIATHGVSDRVDDELGNEHCGRMFVTFRLGTYPLSYRALAERSPARTVVSLIGNQSEQQLGSLRKLARQFAFDARFIQSGAGMVRAMRASLADGCPGIILLDPPWSKAKASPDVTYAAPGGHFRGFTTTERLLDLIDPGFELVFVEREYGSARIRRRPLRDVADAFAWLGHRITSDPADYERLDELHRFFAFARPSGTMVSFRAKDQRYAIHARSMRAWKLPSTPRLDLCERGTDGLCHDAELRTWLAEIADDEVDAILCL